MRSVPRRGIVLLSLTLLLLGSPMERLSTAPDLPLEPSHPESWPWAASPWGRLTMGPPWVSQRP